MRGSGSFQPSALTDALKPFDSGAISATTGLAPLLDYYRFYNLDFSGLIPGLVHTIGWLPSGDHRIAVQRFAHPEPRGSALVCHGYYDHVGLYGHLIAWLLEQGLTVLAFDLPGHGLSSGPRATIDSFDEYVQVLRDLVEEDGFDLPQPWYAVGQSLGGTVTMEYLVQETAQQRANPFKTVVLLAPLVRPHGWGFSRWVYLVARHTISERPRTLTDNAENPEFMALMRRDPLAPQTLPVQWVAAMVEWMKRFEKYPTLPFSPLVVQGHADRTVDWKHGLGELRRMSEPRILEIPAARHHLVNESPEIRRQIFEWLQPHLKG